MAQYLINITECIFCTCSIITHNLKVLHYHYICTCHITSIPFIIIMYLYDKHTIFYKPSYNSSLVTPFQVKVKGTSCIPIIFLFNITLQYFFHKTCIFCHHLLPNNTPLPQTTWCWHCFCLRSLHLPCYY